MSVLDPRKLPPDEEVMWRTAELRDSVPSFYVKTLLRRLRGEDTSLASSKSYVNTSSGQVRRECGCCRQPLPEVEPLKAGEKVRVLRGEWKDCEGATEQAEASGYVTVRIEMHVSLPVDTLTRVLP